jgi:hypothetical protein
METVQVRLSAETVLHPVQLARSEPAGTSAVSVTMLPFGAEPLQVPLFAAHARAGSVALLVRVPCAAPKVLAVFAVTRYVAGWNVAVTLRFMVIDTVHVRLSAEKLVQPVQPVTIAPGSGDAVSVTVAPFGAWAEHGLVLGEHEMAGSVATLETVPMAVPAALAVIV